MYVRLQAGDKGVDGPAKPRQVSPVQHTATTHPGAWYPATPHTLLAHLTRVRQSCHRRGSHCHTELSFWIDETLGKDVSIGEQFVCEFFAKWCCGYLGYETQRLKRDEEVRLVEEGFGPPYPLQSGHGDTSFVAIQLVCHVLISNQNSLPWGLLTMIKTTSACQLLVRLPIDLGQLPPFIWVVLLLFRRLIKHFTQPF